MPKKSLTVICICFTFLAISYLFENKFCTYAQTEVSFERHIILDIFSVMIPPNWTITVKSRNNDFFVLSNYEMENKESIDIQSIKTEFVFVCEPLNIILENQLRAIKQSEEDIIKQGDLIIDGHSAKRVWYQGNGLTFPNTISSYIPYGNAKTVVIHSYYNPANTLAVDTIEKIHWSFQNLE